MRTYRSDAALRACFAALLILFGSGGLSAQDGDGGTQPVLQEMGVSARAYALGRAYTAMADDPSAVFWNPAGLEYAPRMSFSLFHMPLIIDGASHEFIGFAYPTVSFGTVGLGYSRVGVGEITTSDLDGRLTGTDASYDYSEIYISYAKRAWFSITPGVTFKFHRQAFSLDNRVGSGFGMDLGMMYRPDFENALLQGLSLGFRFQNLIKPQLKPGSVQDTIANKISVGLMKSVTLGETGKLNILLDYVQGEVDGGRIHAGTEYRFQDLGTVRLGMDGGTPAFGAGVSYRFMTIDYSFGNLSTDGAFPATHRFSLTFDLGLSRQEKVFLAEEARLERERELVEATREEERQRRVAEGMRKGQEFLDQERFFDAYSEFQQVIADDPFNKQAKVLFDSSRAMIQSQFDARQEQAVSEAVDKELALENQRYLELHFEKGQVYLQNKQFTDALIEFNLALERSPGDPIIQEAINTTNRRLNQEVRTLVTQAREEFQVGNTSNALRILSEALILSPESPELQQEIEILTKRIKLQQYIADGLTHLGEGDYPAAFRVFEEALQLDPSNEAIQRYYDQARLGRDSRQQRMKAEDEKQFIIGTEHFLAGRYDKALEIWRELARKDENRFNKKLQDAIKTAEDRIRRSGNGQ